MFWEIMQKLPELQSTENVAEDGILWSGCSHEDGQLQSDNNCQQERERERGYVHLWNGENTEMVLSL